MKVRQKTIERESKQQRQHLFSRLAPCSPFLLAALKQLARFLATPRKDFDTRSTRSSPVPERAAAACPWTSAEKKMEKRRRHHRQHSPHSGKLCCHVAQQTPQLHARCLPPSRRCCCYWLVLVRRPGSRRRSIARQTFLKNARLQRSPLCVSTTPPQSWRLCCDTHAAVEK